MDHRLDLLTAARAFDGLLANGVPDNTEIQVSLEGRLCKVTGIDYEGTVSGSQSIVKITVEPVAEPAESQ